MEVKKSSHKCGMVSIVGRPNVGKSTLLNCIIGEKVAIVSDVPQTTRNQVRGIHTDDNGNGQIVFIDTPGLHKGCDQLDSFMNNASSGAIDDVDCVIYLVDTTRQIGQEEENIAEQLAKSKKPIILALNKVDIKQGALIPEYIAFWERVKGQSVNEMDNFAMIPLSGERGTNVDELLKLVFDQLPEGPALYPDDIISDTPQRMMMADLIREKLFQLMKKEVPHSIGVAIERVQPVKGKTLNIKAVIMVERDTQKEIVIGKKGEILKKVGSLARVDLEDLLESKVFLEMFVKVQKRWRSDVSLLKDLGYSYQ